MDNVQKFIQETFNKCEFLDFINYDDKTGVLNFRHSSAHHGEINIYTLLKLEPFDFSRPGDVIDGETIYTPHYIHIKDQHQRNTAIKCYNAYHSMSKTLADPLSDGGTMLSRKPKPNDEEKLLHFLYRWGRIFGIKTYEYMTKKTKRLITIEDIKTKVIYDFEGEVNGYNEFKKINNIQYIGYNPNITDSWINISDIKDAKYIGAKIGKVIKNVNSNINDEDRIIEIFGQSGEDFLERLSDIKICIIGLGGTGSNVAESLIKKGAKKFIFFDSDNIEKSNLSRLSLLAHIKYNNSIKEIAKVDIFDELDLHIEKHNNLIRGNESYIQDADIIISCVDNTETRKLIIELANKYSIPTIDTGIGYDKEKNIQTKSLRYYKLPGIQNYTYNAVEKSKDEYGIMANLQIADSCIIIAGFVSTIITKLCGLYPYPNINIPVFNIESDNTKSDWDNMWMEMKND